MKPVQSTNIEAAGYDRASRTLAIKFRGGGLYHYHHVPNEVLPGLLSSKSPGGFFRERINGKFTYTKRKENGNGQG